MILKMEPVPHRLSIKENGKFNRHLGLGHSQVGLSSGEFRNYRMSVALKLR